MEKQLISFWVETKFSEEATKNKIRRYLFVNRKLGPMPKGISEVILANDEEVKRHLSKLVENEPDPKKD